MDDPNVHHDAIEFPDGEIVLLTRLRAGQRGTVLQLPRNPVVDNEPISSALGSNITA
jgi:hypothetical protein